MRRTGEQTLLVRYQLILSFLELPPQFLHVESGVLGAGEDTVARILLFADMVFHVLAEHGDFRVVIIVALVALDQIGDQQLDGVVLDLRFVQLVMLDAFLAAGGIEDLLFDNRMGGERRRDLPDQLLALLAALVFPELAEQLLDLAVVGFQQLYRVLLAALIRLVGGFLTGFFGGGVGGGAGHLYLVDRWRSGWGLMVRRQCPHGAGARRAGRDGSGIRGLPFRAGSCLNRPGFARFLDFLPELPSPKTGCGPE